MMSTLPPPPGDRPQDELPGTGEPSDEATQLPPPPAGDPGSGREQQRGYGPGSQTPPPGSGQQQSWGAYGTPYRAPLSPSEERTWAMLAHLSGLTFLFGLPVIGPLVVWLVKREQSSFVDAEGKEALNFSLSVLLYSVVGGILGAILTAITLGIGIIPVALIALIAGVAWLVLVILAAVAASNGQPYRYPFNIRFIK